MEQHRLERYLQGSILSQNYKIDIIIIQIRMSNPNFVTILSLTYLKIQQFSQDQVDQHIGIGNSLTAEQHLQCEWQLAFLFSKKNSISQRLARQELEKKNAQNEEKIQRQEKQILEYQKEKKSYKSFWLDGARGLELAYLLINTYAVNLIITGITTPITDLEKQIRNKNLCVLSSFGAVVGLALIVWIIVKVYYLCHT